MSYLLPQSLPQPDSNPRIQNFWGWLDDEQQLAYGYSGLELEKRSQFVPSSVLKAYFESPRKLQRILDALFPNTDDPIEAETILEGDYLTVFVILLSISKGTYIEHFVHHEGLRDDKFPLEARPYEWPKTKSSEDFWEDFKAAQWKFYPYTFARNKTDIRVGSRRILPITERELIKEGGSSKIFKIKIHPDYDRLESAQDTGETPGESPRTYVLKVYSDLEGDDNYNSEVNTFRKLGAAGSPESGIITFYGSFVQNETYNVLLQYADGGTLEDYFQSVDPPRHPSHIYQFWKSFFGLFRAINRIHDMNPNEEDGRKGWHQDIKPANILVIRGTSGSWYDCQFVLADLGLSHYMRSRRRPGEATSPDVGGTREYGAPECHRRDSFLQEARLHVRQSVDIWSLGCVFSEAVVWMCCLKSGLVDYRERRRAFTESQPQIKDPGCFHDGKKASPVVAEVHEWALNSIPKSDTLTGSVLVLVADMMVPYTHRLHAEQLWHRSLDILQAPQGDSGPMGIQRQGTGWSNSVAQRPNSTFFQGSNRPLNWSPPYSSGAMSRRPGSPDHELRTSTWQTQMTRPNRALSPNLPDLEHGPEDEDSAASPSTDSPPNFRNGGRRVPAFPGRVLTFGDDVDNEKAHHLGMPRGLQRRPDELATLTETDLEYGRPPRGLTKAQTYGSHPSEELARPTAKNKERASDPIIPSVKDHEDDTTTQPPLPKADTRPAPPYLSVATAHMWVKARNRDAHLPHREHLAFLHNRDHVFLVDNSSSMQLYWDDVAHLLRILAWIVKKSDRDGLDLYYSMSSDYVNSKRSSTLIEDLKRRRPYGQSDISVALGRILSTYQQKLDESASSRTRFDPFIRRPFRPMTVYVFTDAVWREKCDGSKPIISMIEKLESLGIPNDSKQIGVQFISFGNDQKCLDKLVYLDDGLKQRYGRDIVDTEPSNGNVWKMFLGSINRYFDES